MTKVHTDKASAPKSSQVCATNLPGEVRRRLGSRLPNRWARVAITGIAACGVVLSGIGADADGFVAGLLGATDKNGNPQSVGAAGLAMIEEFEGLELTGYVLGDGMCTIGYGHAVPISEKPKAECEAWNITQAEAEAFLKEDTERFANKLNEYFDRPFTQNQFDALVSFSYNVGYAYEKYDWSPTAPDSYFPGVMILYTNPPQFKEGLTKRRKAEIALFEDPNDPIIEIVTEAPPALRSLQLPSSTPEPYEIPTVVYTPGAAVPVTTPSPVTTFPAIEPLFKGSFGER